MLHIPVTTYYCPNCWREIDPEAGRCPYCGYDLAMHEPLSYEEKLLLALRHPVRENRMTAITLLGERRSLAALPAWKRLLEHEEDFYVLRAVLQALARLDVPESRRLLQKALHHPSRLVRREARALLGDPDAPVQ